MPNNTSKSSENAPDAPAHSGQNTKSIGSRNSFLSIGSVNSFCSIGSINSAFSIWLGFLVRVYRLGFFFAVHCLVPELYERAIGFIGNICALGTVVQVGA